MSLTHSRLQPVSPDFGYVSMNSDSIGSIVGGAVHPPYPKTTELAV
jgi:hypothetical protein